MRGRENPPLDLTPEPNGTPLTFDIMAMGYLQDYQLQRYRSLTTRERGSSTFVVSSAGSRP